MSIYSLKLNILPLLIKKKKMLKKKNKIVMLATKWTNSLKSIE